VQGPGERDERSSVHAPTRAERRDLVQVLARAFRDNPMNVAIHGPNPARRVRANAAGLRSVVLDQESMTFSRVITYEGEVVGGFVAARPSWNPLPLPSLRRRLECFWLQGGPAVRAWAEVSLAMPDHRPRDNHWYLVVLGVEPAKQGRGSGRRLLDALFAEVAAEPGEICLECDRPESVRFYERAGFANREETEVHGVPCWCLGRSVR